MEIQEFKISDPKEGWSLIKVAMCNVCGSDLHTWRGETPPFGRGGMPVILGHEMTGTVYKLGKGVHKDAMGKPLKEGDRVVYSYYSSCGHCPSCLTGAVNECGESLMRVIQPVAMEPHMLGGFSEYYYAQPGQHIFKVPDELSDEAVAGVNCALSQVLHGLLQTKLTFGESVVIQGAGGLGLYATAVAREMGAHQVIVIDGVDARLKMAKQMGADEIIDLKEYPDGKSRVKKVMELTGRWGADLIVEVVGFPEVMPEGIRMMCRGGRYLTLGNVMPRATYKEDPSILVGGNRSIQGVSLYPPMVLKKALDFLSRAKDRYPLASMPEKYSLADINKAFEDANEYVRGGNGVARASIDFSYG
jgi:D-arabinose 1-dehydrogenase-like Zn-dependent alcohol dehydrogenase